MIKPDRYDVIIIISVMIHLAVVFTSAMVMSMTADLSGTNIEKVVEVIEANPIMRVLIVIEGYAVVFKYVLGPAILFGGYFAIRKALMRFGNAKDMETVLSLFVCMLFFAMIANLANDVGFLVGLILKGG